MAPVIGDDTVRGRHRAPEPDPPVTPAGEPAPLPPGAELGGGRYRLGGVLGRGGFGITYAATDLRLQRPVAVKELVPEGAAREGRRVVVPDGAGPSFARARDRFLREATTLARFGHPGIVRIFAVLEENATAYLVLERIEGRTLAAELRERRGPFTEPEALDVAAQAAEALAAVHGAGVLHRDVSPANLVRTPDGRIVLIDFGLARAFVEDRTTMMTRIVTPGYAPPEQHAGNGRFSARADVYALAATLYRLLTGTVPPVAAERVGGDGLVPLWRINPTVSHRTSDAIGDALALDPADRPASVADLLDRLGARAPAGRAGEGYGPAVDAVGSPEEAGAEGDDGLAPDLATEVVPPAAVVFAPVVPSPRSALAGAGAGPDDAGHAGSWVVPAPVVDEGAERARRRRSRPAAPPAAGARLDLVDGTAPVGRRWITLPLGVAAVALASAQPATLIAVLGIGMAPVLATVGDRQVQPGRSPAWWPVWWLRNVALGVVRTLGALCVLAIGLCLWFGADAFEALAPAGPWILRTTGVVAATLLVVSIARGGPGFRSHVALDAVARALVPRGRPTFASGVLLLVCLAVAAAGLAFEPEAWPLR
ncbi:protein kinase [Iamia sp. SCSIO 61187]|uniref:serine/threonine-protein kinase n=1 Tax=Iamia sp. SCSIO 61187 TaxID=2722752 RepID=UPI001C629AAF|nr:serine/threonine-protein kinase [Iamia sp. SCSIO 61187]QYG93493.1 protein kinase [Iamia sp. SCSIO 61187]